jgi:hypothetical protein
LIAVTTNLATARLEGFRIIDILGHEMKRLV